MPSTEALRPNSAATPGLPHSVTQRLRSQLSETSCLSPLAVGHGPRFPGSAPQGGLEALLLCTLFTTGVSCKCPCWHGLTRADLNRGDFLTSSSVVTEAAALSTLPRRQRREGQEILCLGVWGCLSPFVRHLVSAPGPQSRAPAWKSDKTRV